MHRVALKDLGKFEKRLADKLRHDRSYLHELGEACVAFLRLKSIEIKHTGAFQNGWAYRVDNGHLYIFNRAPHANFVERGRGPGKMPPVEALRRWSMDKFGVDLGFVVARKIGREGIKPRPVLSSVENQRAMANGIIYIKLSSTFSRWLRASRV